MNIDTVNELIQSLESAGELSIKERKYLELAKAYADKEAESVAQALTFEKCRELSGCPAGVDLQDWVKRLAAENVALKGMHHYSGLSPKRSKDAMLDMKRPFIDELIYSAEFYSVCGHISASLNRAISAVHGDYSWLPETPATDRIVAGIKADAQSEVIEWLDAEITAIDTMYRGDPSYEHDAYWMKSKVLDVVELARKAFSAQMREGADK
ncbi:hypothetical protein [Klebsiella aerogenes]|uniref:hypothetical protein n=1 Tax=Klebsiella aerogenes TaxID=548 RepID=UPI0029317171|nr:hypothetical protein [Klebsiella aerogenes]